MARLKSSLPPPMCPNYVESSYSSLSEHAFSRNGMFCHSRTRAALRIEVQGPLPIAEAKSIAETKSSPEVKPPPPPFGLQKEGKVLVAKMYMGKKPPPTQSRLSS